MLMRSNDDQVVLSNHAEDDVIIEEAPYDTSLNYDYSD